MERQRLAIGGLPGHVLLCPLAPLPGRTGKVLHPVHAWGSHCTAGFERRTVECLRPTPMNAALRHRPSTPRLRCGYLRFDAESRPTLQAVLDSPAAIEERNTAMNDLDDVAGPANALGRSAGAFDSPNARVAITFLSEQTTPS